MFFYDVIYRKILLFSLWKCDSVEDEIKFKSIRMLYVHVCDMSGIFKLTYQFLLSNKKYYHMIGLSIWRFVLSYSDFQYGRIMNGVRVPPSMHVLRMRHKPNGAQ